MPIRLLIADDDALIREGLSIILGLDPEFLVVATAGNGAEAIARCRENPDVDVVLLDIRMPVMDGLAASAVLAGELGRRVLILTTFDEENSVSVAIRNGVKGYLMKNSPPERIKAAIRMVNDGGTVMQDEVMDRLRDSMNRGGPASQTVWNPDAEADTKTSMDVDLSCAPDGKSPNRRIPPGLFTERELEVLALLADGLSNREIASRMFITEGTTKNHITALLSKTGLDHRTQLAIYWLNAAR